jgi:hypothetical protein
LCGQTKKIFRFESRQLSRPAKKLRYEKDRVTRQDCKIAAADDCYIIMTMDCHNIGVVATVLI